MDEENHVVHLLASLPESYDTLVTPLEASEKFLQRKLSLIVYCMNKGNLEIVKDRQRLIGRSVGC